MSNIVTTLGNAWEGFNSKFTNKNDKTKGVVEIALKNLNEDFLNYMKIGNTGIYKIKMGDRSLKGVLKSHYVMERHLRKDLCIQRQEAIEHLEAEYNEKRRALGLKPDHEQFEGLFNEAHGLPLDTCKEINDKEKAQRELNEILNHPLVTP